MLLITGANGHLGSAIIDFLLSKHNKTDIAGLVRNSEKGKAWQHKGVGLRVGDYSDYGSLQAAMKGVKRVMLISSSTFPDRVGQHANVMQAAKEAGVQQIFYTSMLQASKLLSPIAEDHAGTEKLLTGSGIPYTIFRNTFYAEYLPWFLGNAMESGHWYFPSQGAKVNLALRAEMAEAAANALAQPEQHQNKTYEFASTQAYTLQEIADKVSAVSGKKISYHDLSVESFKERMRQAGLPQEVITLQAGVGITFSKGALDYTGEGMQPLLYRKPTDLKAYVDHSLSGHQ